MSHPIQFASLLLIVASVVACDSDVPCLTKGQMRTSSGCVCPDGTRFVEDLENQTSECVQEDGDVDVDSVRAGDGGMKDSGDLSGKPSAGPSRSDAGTEKPDRGPSRMDASSAERDAATSQPGLNEEDSSDGNAADRDRGAPAACVPEAEDCDGKDDDCDGEIDEGLKNACGAACGMAVPPEDCATPADDDCDGTKNEGCAPPSPSCVPRAETCDGTDEDCDGVPDNGVLNACKKCGSVPAETCNGQDDNCDGTIDEGVKVRCWRDSDRDGYAAAGAVVTESCECGTGQTSQEPTAGQRDCADADSKVKPGIAESCSTPADDNCSGQANEGCCVATSEVCDGMDNDCDSLVDEPLKNACGGPCDAPVPKEDCATAGDDNCNGQMNEGCAVCGDARVTSPEECDPKASGWTAFTCGPDCKRNTIYGACKTSADCFGTVGRSSVICNSYGVCSIMCPTEGATGTASGCPKPPGNLTAMCTKITGDFLYCFASGCTASNESGGGGCAPGTTCAANDQASWCVNL